MLRWFSVSVIQWFTRLVAQCVPGSPVIMSAVQQRHGHQCRQSHLWSCTVRHELLGDKSQNKNWQSGTDIVYVRHSRGSHTLTIETPIKKNSQSLTGLLLLKDSALAMAECDLRLAKCMGGRLMVQPHKIERPIEESQKAQRACCFIMALSKMQYRHML